MKEFNMNLFIKKLQNLERLIISAEKSIESNNPKDYVSLLSYYKEIILLNLNYCQVRQILLKVIELNEKILKDNIKDLDCFIAFGQFLALTYDFAEDYNEKQRISYLFIVNYESAKLLKPNDFQIIFEYCNGLNKLRRLLFSDEDFANEENFIHFKKIPEIRRFIYKLLYENYSFAEKSGYINSENYINYLKAGFYYFTYFNHNEFPKRLLNKSIMIFENYIFPNNDVFKSNPDLKEILNELITLLWEKENTLTNNVRKKIYSLFVLFKNSPIKNNGESYSEFMKGLVYATIGNNKNEYWQEAFNYANEVLETGKTCEMSNYEFESLYHNCYYLHLYYLKTLKTKNEMFPVLFKILDILNEAKPYNDKMFTKLINNITFLIDYVKNTDEKEIIEKGGEWIYKESK